MAIEAIAKKVSDSDFKLPMDNKVVAEAVQSGDLKKLHKVLVDYGLVIQDYKDFAASQYGKFMDILQSYAPYIHDGMVAPPTMLDMLDQEPAFYMSQEDMSVANSMFEEVLGVGDTVPGGGKGMSMGKAVGGAPATSDIQNDLSGWNNFFDSVLEARIFESQYQQAMSQKSEFENELRKLLMMARNGTLDDPAILLLALAKFNCEKAGRASVQAGYGIHVEMNRQNRAVDNWRGGTQDYASTQMLNLDLKKSTQTVTDFTNLVNSAAKFSETWSTMVKSSLESMHNTRMEIVRRLGL